MGWQWKKWPMVDASMLHVSLRCPGSPFILLPFPSFGAECVGDGMAVEKVAHGAVISCWMFLCNVLTLLSFQSHTIQSHQNLQGRGFGCHWHVLVAPGISTNSGRAKNLPDGFGPTPSVPNPRSCSQDFHMAEATLGFRICVLNYHLCSTLHNSELSELQG